MKIRSGFVSNSSSSSFVVFWKGDITKERILEQLGVQEGSFFYSFAKEVAQVLLPFGDEIACTVEQLRDLERYPRDDVEWREDFAREIKFLENGWKVYRGMTSNEDRESASQWLTYESIDIHTDDLIIEKEAGF